MAKSKKSSTGGNASGFKSAVADLEKLCGSKARPLKDAKGGFMCTLHPSKKKSFKLEKVQADFLKRGAFVVNTEATEKGPIGILPTADKYEAILIVGTSAPNWDLEPQDIVKWLRKLEKDQP